MQGLKRKVLQSCHVLHVVFAVELMRRLDLLDHVVSGFKTWGGEGGGGHSVVIVVKTGVFMT